MQKNITERLREWERDRPVVSHPERLCLFYVVLAGTILYRVTGYTDMLNFLDGETKFADYYTIQSEKVHLEGRRLVDGDRRRSDLLDVPNDPEPGSPIFTRPSNAEDSVVTELTDELLETTP